MPVRRLSAPGWRRGWAAPALIASAVVAWLALGPWVLLGLAALRSRRVRSRLPGVRPLLAWGVGLLVTSSLVLWLAPPALLPLPPGPGLLVTQGYAGRPAIPDPVRGYRIPQHPHLAANGRNSMHNDGWASDAYSWAGPIGLEPEVDTAWYGIEECATLAFDRSDRLVGLCGDLNGPVLRMIDPESLRPLASLELPERRKRAGVPAWEDLCGGAYFYLDESDRAVVATTDRRVLVVDTATASGRPQLQVEQEHDLTGAIPEDDCLVALMPDWSGPIWFATRQGRVGVLDPVGGRARVLELGEEIANSLAVDQEAAYVVTSAALYRLRIGGRGRPESVWRVNYDPGPGRKPGQLVQGSGTTPTLLPDGSVAITDNAEPRMNVISYDRRTGRERCRVPVFEEGESATENSLVGLGDAVIVENNYGYRSPLTTSLGRATSAGVARVDLARCRVEWTTAVSAPTSVPKASLANGLVYVYSTRRSWLGVNAWYLTALSARTGLQVFSVRTGAGLWFNNHYAAITLAPDASAYIATLGGLIRIRDRS